MQILGRPSDFCFESQGTSGQEKVFRNLSRGQLIETAITKGECQLSHTGAIVVNTGKFTGRSPKDKYIVNYELAADEVINWNEINQPIAPEKVETILQQMLSYTKGKNLFLQDLYAGKAPQYSLKLQIITELAWQSLFCRNMFSANNDRFVQPIANFTILDLPGFFASPKEIGLNSGTFIILDFNRSLVLIGGTAYAGEIKKAVFTIMNKLLPEQGVLSMHCSANIGKDGKTALFFGLSGTGKTTLSSDVDRFLIGDDETGWANDGIFNFENGCYAKTLGLKRESEPLIYNASTRFGTLLENVAYNPESRQIDFSDSSVSENARSAYPIEFIDDSVASGLGEHPENIFFLSADAFGVLPPISLLNENQVMEYFLAGFTAKLSGTEQGLEKVPQATFSTCFAAPFLPLRPSIYANLLHKKLQKHHSRVWLVNTGWSGGVYGVGVRIKLQYTRTLIRAAICGDLNEKEMREDEIFHLAYPRICDGVPAEILNPASTWKSLEEYAFQAKKLMELFKQNKIY